jgi:transaldolase
MRSIGQLKIKLFVDAADLRSIVEWCQNPLIKGLTTNPTLMRKAGVSDYEEFSRKILNLFPNLPISIEVFADDLEGMESQAQKIASWGANAFVKIPITNTKKESTFPIIRRLSDSGVPLNITAVMTSEQVAIVKQALHRATPTVVSVFAGRIADTGVDPVPIMQSSLQILQDLPNAELLWASPREILNLFQADEIGTHIITVTPDLLTKCSIVGRDLETYSLETVKMFHDDAVAARYSL